MSAVMAGCETWNEIELFGKAKRDWLDRYIDISHGIPSHDTFNRFFSALDPDKFEDCFRGWISSIISKISEEMATSEEPVPDIISIDGKTIRGSRTYYEDAIHMVTAWSNQHKICLGQLRTSEKSNEIKAIPELLDSLFTEGSTITIDAMGCHTHIAEKIVNKNANYVIGVKANQKFLMQGIIDSFRFMPSVSEHQTLDGNHGRIETRNYSVISDLSMIQKAGTWPGLQSIIMVNSESVEKITGEITTSTRYYVSSLPADARNASHAIRSHWGIENELHWVMDVVFDEDRSRKRNRNAVINFSLLNKIALMTLKKDVSLNVGMKSKRRNAMMDSDYLSHLLSLL